MNGSIRVVRLVRRVAVSAPLGCFARAVRGVVAPARAAVFVALALLAGCQTASPPPRGPAPQAHLASVEPRLVDGLLVIRYEVVNDGTGPIHLLDGLASPPAAEGERPFDPLVRATPTPNGVVRVRKGDLPAPERRFFVTTTVPVLTTVAPGERFSEVFRTEAPAGEIRGVVLSLFLMAGMPTQQAASAEGRVLTAAWPALWSARWQLDSDLIPLGGPLPLGGD